MTRALKKLGLAIRDIQEETDKDSKINRIKEKIVPLLLQIDDFALYAALKKVYKNPKSKKHTHLYTVLKSILYGPEIKLFEEREIGLMDDPISDGDHYKIFECWPLKRIKKYLKGLQEYEIGFANSQEIIAASEETRKRLRNKYRIHLEVKIRSNDYSIGR